MDEIIQLLFEGEANSRKLRRRFGYTKAELKQVLAGKRAIRQSKGSLIFPGIPKGEREYFKQELFKEREKRGEWVAPVAYYHIYRKQAVAYILANANPFTPNPLEYRELLSGITWFLLMDYIGQANLEYDAKFMYGIVLSELRKLKRMGYTNYYKKAKEEHKDLFVSKVRYHCIRRVEDERKCDTARKECTAQKIEEIAKYILQNLKTSKLVRKYMTPDGGFKKKFMEMIQAMISKKFDVVLGFRRLRQLIAEALELIGTTRETIVEEHARFNVERDDFDESFFDKLKKKYKERLRSVIGYIQDMLEPKYQEDTLVFLQC